MVNDIKERRLRWMGHLLIMEDSTIPHTNVILCCQTVTVETESEGIQEEATTAKEKLDGHCQTRSV